MSRLILGSLVVGAGLTLAGNPIAAAASSAADQALLKSVSQQLLNAVDAPPPEFAWPPDFAIIDGPINAFASRGEKDSAGKWHPIVRVYSQMMTKVVERDPNRLALILGHELNHILRKHVLHEDPRRDRTQFLTVTFTREQEMEADQTGVELMLKAGFSFRKGVRAVKKMQDLGLTYSSFEGLGLDHPSWNDRMARVDKDQAHYWKSMAAFSNGVWLLTAEQYPDAAACFETVTSEFPECYEAWVDLGFAKLMMYCDKLSKDNLRDYDIGQVMVGGFYQRAESIKLRGPDERLWSEAVDALRQALRIKPDLTLAKADLGMAYLVHPQGRQAGIGEATKLMLEAADAAAQDTTIDPQAYAALLANLGVTNLAAGRTREGLAQLDQAEQKAKAFAGGSRGARNNAALSATLLYNRAAQLATAEDRSSKEKALGMFEEYLKSTSPLSLWWPLAYDRYAALCQAVGKPAKAPERFKSDRPEAVRPAASIRLQSGKEIKLAEEVEAVVKRLGKGKETVVVPGGGLKRIRYDADHVELLVTEVVVAIRLAEPKSPPLPLRGSGLGTGTAVELKVGMPAEDVDRLLGDVSTPQVNYGNLTAEDVSYRFYHAAGVALRISKGKVAEIVITQIVIPRST